MPLKYRELWHDHGTSWLASREYTPDPGSETVVVKATHSLVSQGTERRVTSGKLQAPEEARIPHMKGSFSDRFTYGYSLVGRVELGPEAMMGRYVHLLHPHQEMAFVHPSEVSQIPDDLSPNIATLASNMETAVNAMWDAAVEVGDKVLIVGYGTIGALVALLVAQIPGVELIVLELNPTRSATAKAAGHSVVSSKDELECNFDIAFNASTSFPGLQIAIDTTRVEGKIIELSWHGSTCEGLDLGGAFHFGRKRIISSQVSSIPISRQHNWSFGKRKDLVFKLLTSLLPSELVENEIAFEAAPAYFDRLRANEISEISTVIKY